MRSSASSWRRSHDELVLGARLEVLRVLPGDLEGRLASLVEYCGIGSHFKQGFGGLYTALVGGPMEGCASLPVLGVQVGPMSGEQAYHIRHVGLGGKLERGAVGLIQGFTKAPRSNSISVHSTDPARAAQWSGVIP